MKKIALGLVVLVSLVFADFTQEQIKDFDKRCKDGESFSCGLLGECYLSGAEGLSKDYKKAKFYLEKVCKKGNEKDGRFAAACSNLGFLYANGGYGVPQDYKKASKLYNLACDKGEATACQNIGAMYYDGWGVPQDRVKGAGYFRRACDAGDWAACRNFALYHYDFGNQSKAAQYYKKACEMGRNDYGAQNDPEDRKIWQEACDMSSILN